MVSAAGNVRQTGYFDERSMLRRVHRERAVALSGPRALLMQAAHPLAVFGLLAHSSALDEPYERLARTAQTMDTIAFGSRAEADRLTRRVRAMHRRVSGKLLEPVGAYDVGTTYRADDPKLLLWVLFSLVDSALVVLPQVRPLADARRGSGLLGGLQDRRAIVRAEAERAAGNASTSSTPIVGGCSTATSCM